MGGQETGDGHMPIHPGGRPLDYRPPEDLEVRPPFSTLFPIDSKVLDAVTASMQATGYDPSKPIDV
jgi:hypothetical protein